MTAWPTDPNGSLVPILEASVEAAKQRHPSASGAAPGVVLTLADRCDHCGSAAVYRVMMRMATPEIVQPTLDFCLHYFRKAFPAMAVKGWAVAGGNPDLLAAMQLGADGEAA